MAKIHWSATVTAVFYLLWLMGPFMYLLTGLLVHKGKLGVWVEGDLNTLAFFNRMNEFAIVKAALYAVPVYHGMTLIFGTMYGIQSGSSKIGAWVLFGLSQLYMFGPYPLFMGAASPMYNLLGIPLIWLAMMLVLFSPLGNDVSSQPGTKKLLFSGTALVTAFHASALYYFSIRGTLYVVGLVVIGTVMIALAFRNLAKENVKKETAETQSLVSDSKSLPYYG